MSPGQSFSAFGCLIDLMAMGKLVAMIMSALLTLLVTMELAAAGNGASVKIYNHVVGPLWMHCKSADTDLGEKTIADGQVFQWGFNDDFFGRTLYYCDFRWKARTQHVDVWTASIGCKFCVWDVTQAGFYKHEEGDTSGGSFVCPWK
jgi:hypothetical protein